ncbi:MAG: YiiX/YebB-like N1pC/P60 family cysteine hydrolase [Acidobacteriota bacterium]
MTAPPSPTSSRPTDVTATRSPLGRTLETLGRLGWPLALGAVLGYLASDRDVPFVPRFLEMVAVVCGLSLCCYVVGLWMQGRALRGAGADARLRRRTGFALLAGFVAASIRLGMAWIGEPSPLTRLSADEYHAAFGREQRRLETLLEGLDRVTRRLEGLELPTDDTPLTAPQEASLRELWRRFNGNALELERLRIFHEDWYRFDPSRRERDRHVRSFVLQAACETCLLERALHLTRVVDASGTAARFLDAPHPELGFPAGSLAGFRNALLGADELGRARAIGAYLKLLATRSGWRSELLKTEPLLGSLRACLDELGRRDLEQAEAATQVGISNLKVNVRRHWLPMQEDVARWMGDTKLRRASHTFIDDAQREALAGLLEPGDILLMRKNWYLSNVGLPGFWPHAALYLGNPSDFASTFDDPEVAAWIAERTDSSDPALLDVLRARWPERIARFEAAGSDGPPMVLEAIDEGVVLRPLSEATGDYLAALRPQLPPLARAQALTEAFSHLDKPYDYEFDFATDHALVCTELVWRSYRSGPGKEGLALTPRRIAGRLTLPANDIACAVARDQSRSTGLELVTFLDASEGRREAYFSDAATFMASCERSRWDVGLD